MGEAVGVMARAPFLYGPILCLGILLGGPALAQSSDEVAAALAGTVRGKGFGNDVEEIIFPVLP